MVKKMNSRTFVLVWIAICAMTFNIAAGTVELDFRITPEIIKPLETSNVSVQCNVTLRTQYYDSSGWSYYYRGEYRYRTNKPPSGSDKSNIAMIRILKKFQDKWQPIAQINNLQHNIVQKLDSTITNTDGVISDDLTRRSFIRVSWDLATSDVYGMYRCDVISFDNQQNAVQTTSSQITVGSSLDALALLRLLKHDKTDILNKVDTLEKDIDKIGGKIQAAIDSGFLMLWPRGSYGLLQPRSGCPFDGITKWSQGWTRHHTESTDRNKDTLSNEIHLQEPVLERENADNFVTQHFCVKTDEHSVGPTWPRGSYCINKKGKCPTMFDEGSVMWDEENRDSSQTSEGELPDGNFSTNGSTLIEYCCRQDGPTQVPVYLPNSDPFYLYRYGGNCQSVYNMSVAEEFVVFDTENTDNKDEFKKVHPDGRINNVRLELCYYYK